MITGKILRDSYISAANHLANNRKQVDALNVFPVPDGDTGTNMSMTIGAAKRELLLLPDTVTAGETSRIMASALLRGARGNSGVILSLLFRGLSKGLQGKTEASATEFAAAMQYGVDAAYKAVMKPTEGTILTVARMGAERAAKIVKETPAVTVAEMWRGTLEAAEESLAATPEMLPILKKAGVVDAGGRGLTLIMEGMYAVLSGKDIVVEERKSAQQPVEVPVEKNAAGEYEGEITFTYCTEFIVLKEAGRVNPLSLRAYLESIGDSAVVVDDDEIIKCHIHTDNPGSALQKGLEFGSLSHIKIDNMREMHAGLKKSTSPAQADEQFEYAPVDNSREYGFVAVAAGQGVHELFRDLGVDNIVSGGQTMNPSTDNILEAIHATPAKTVIVLPNNKNIIMAAELAVKMADRNVYVLPAKSIPQGLAAMLIFDPELELGQNQLAMVKAIEKVGTGLITLAARDSVFDGHKIKKGEILGLENNRLAFTEKDFAKAVTKLTRSLLKKDSTFVTLLYGEEVSDGEAALVETAVRAKLPDSVDLALINGGQPVYHYMISVE